MGAPRHASGVRAALVHVNCHVGAAAVQSPFCLALCRPRRRGSPPGDVRCVACFMEPGREQLVVRRMVLLRVEVESCHGLGIVWYGRGIVGPCWCAATQSQGGSGGGNGGRDDAERRRGDGGGGITAIGGGSDGGGGGGGA